MIWVSIELLKDPWLISLYTHLFRGSEAHEGWLGFLWSQVWSHGKPGFSLGGLSGMWFFPELKITWWRLRAILYGWVKSPDGDLLPLGNLIRSILIILCSLTIERTFNIKGFRLGGFLIDINNGFYFYGVFCWVKSHVSKSI